MAIGVVANAVTVGTFPVSLSKAFTRSQAYSIYSNGYANGESQRKLISSTSRKTWGLTKALTAAQLTTLRTFYEDHNGATIPFIYNDPYEAGITGQYKVRFNGAWSATLGVGSLRGATAISLIEVA